MVFGPARYLGVGWVDLTWADIHRAHGLFDHPNHLGHVLGLVLIGMVAWMSGLHRLGRRWWALFAAAALGLAATQSRESMAGRAHRRRADLVPAPRGWPHGADRRCASSPSCSPATCSSGRRTSASSCSGCAGVDHAIATPSRHRGLRRVRHHQECTDANKVASAGDPGAVLPAGRAAAGSTGRCSGYGVGQFGGIVAEQHDPNWEKDPRFGPNGFNLYDFTGTTVDSFWLHLRSRSACWATAIWPDLVWLSC